MSTKKRGVYPPEVKGHAIDRFNNGDKAVDIAAELGTSPGMVRKWVMLGTHGKPAKKPFKAYRPKAQDAIIYLRHAKDAMKVVIVEDPSRLDDPVYLFAMLALATLEGRA